MTDTNPVEQQHFDENVLADYVDGLRNVSDVDLEKVNPIVADAFRGARDDFKRGIDEQLSLGFSELDEIEARLASADGVFADDAFEKDILLLINALGGNSNHTRVLEARETYAAMLEERRQDFAENEVRLVRIAEVLGSIVDVEDVRRERLDAILGVREQVGEVALTGNVAAADTVMAVVAERKRRRSPEPVTAEMRERLYGFKPGDVIGDLDSLIAAIAPELLPKGGESDAELAELRRRRYSVRSQLRKSGEVINSRSSRGPNAPYTRGDVVLGLSSSFGDEQGHESEVLSEQHAQVLAGLLSMPTARGFLKDNYGIDLPDIPTREWDPILEELPKLTISPKELDSYRLAAIAQFSRLFTTLDVAMEAHGSRGTIQEAILAYLLPFHNDEKFSKAMLALATSPIMIKVLTDISKKGGGVIQDATVSRAAVPVQRGTPPSPADVARRVRQQPKTGQ